jgi:hypothetical protein
VRHTRRLTPVLDASDPTLSRLDNRGPRRRRDSCICCGGSCCSRPWHRLTCDAAFPFHDVTCRSCRHNRSSARDREPRACRLTIHWSGPAHHRGAASGRLAVAWQPGAGSHASGPPNSIVSRHIWRHRASSSRHHIRRAISVGVGERRLAPAQSARAERNSGAHAAWRSRASPFSFQGEAVLLRSAGSSCLRGRKFAARSPCRPGPRSTAGRSAPIHERVAERSYVLGGLMSTLARRSHQCLRSCQCDSRLPRLPIA